MSVVCVRGCPGMSGDVRGYPGMSRHVQECPENPGKSQSFMLHTDRNFVVISSQQVLHFDLEVKYYEEHFSKSNFYILVIRFVHSK